MVSIKSTKTRDVGAIVTALRSVHESEGLSSERAMAEQLNVKRHQLRKALQILRESGEIEHIASRVRQLEEQPPAPDVFLDRASLEEIFELRLMLEPYFARQAAVRASPVQIKKILKAAAISGKSNSVTAEMNFYKSVAAATGNSLAVAFHAIGCSVRTTAKVKVWQLSIGGHRTFARREADYQRIADRIAVRDAEGAEKAMRSHLLALRKENKET